MRMMEEEVGQEVFELGFMGIVVSTWKNACANSATVEEGGGFFFTL